MSDIDLVVRAGADGHRRWTASRASNVVHQPLLVKVNAMSLSYPPHLPNPKAGAVSSGRAGRSSGYNTPAAPSSTAKLSHRQKYEAMLAVSSRPPPSLYSVGMEVAAVVKSDPLSGKVSKGFWGPGQDANFHLRPHWDTGTVSALFIPRRSQTHTLWGLVTGSTVHTTMQSRTHAAHGGRANSVNVTSKAQDMHEGAILSIHQPDSSGVDPLKWVTGGQDGRIKYWQLHPSAGRPGKKAGPDAEPAVITCLFSSEPIEEPLKNRSEEVRLRQLASPDGIFLVACDTDFDVVCGVTEDGDLHAWFDVVENPREVRIDVGAAEELGGVRRLELNCRETRDGLVASVLVHHHKHPNFTRYDVSLRGEGHNVKTTFFSTPGEGALTCVRAFLQPNPPISEPAHVVPTLSARIVTPSNGSGTTTPVPDLELDALPKKLEAAPEYGRVIMGGDEFGRAYIWEWDGHAVGDVVQPMRDWAALDGKVTAVEMSCGLVAVGGYSGHSEVFDALPPRPTQLRSFRPPTHLSPGDLLVAASEEDRARSFNVNHIILENDLIISAVGRNVISWRAGTGKGRQSGKELNNNQRKAGGGGGGKGEFRGHSRALDLRDLHSDAVDSHYEIQADNEALRAQSTNEEQHMAAMEDLGLLDGDAALEYALRLSQQEADSAPGQADDYGPEDPDAGDLEQESEEAEAIRLVAEFEREEAARRQQAEDDELAGILEEIRLAEQLEKDQQSRKRD